MRLVSFQLTFKLFQLVLVVIFGYSTYLVFNLYQFTQELRHMESERFQMVLKANELRQSSDYLTDFARRYVVTGNEQFLQNFNHVLDMRNGVKPRPVHYEAIYWSLQEPERSQRHPDGPKEVLREAIRKLPYTEKELAYLTTAENSSNDLVNLEVEAFNAMKGLFKDSHNEFTIRGAPDRAYAIKLLHSPEYDEAKHEIMLPIDMFMVELSERLAGEIATKEAYQRELIARLPILLTVNLILFALSFAMITRRINIYHDELRDMSQRDFLTGIYNRKYVMDREQLLLSLNRRSNKKMAVLLMDVDFFKKINDNYGHTTGDEVLKNLCDVISKRVRDSDIFARYGGEEFIFILNGINEVQAIKYAEEIRQMVIDNPLKTGKIQVDYTVSIGLRVHGASISLQRFINDADQALYKAKEDGRNQVCVYKNEEKTQDAIPSVKSIHID